MGFLVAVTLAITAALFASSAMRVIGALARRRSLWAIAALPIAALVLLWVLSCAWWAAQR